MNVIFIALDTLRADHLRCYGYEKPTSPNLDRLASKGVVFERCYASDIPTQPAYTTMYTGRYGVEHGIVSHGSDIQALPSGFKLFTELLRGAGYSTVAVDNLAAMKPWFHRGYEYYVMPHGHIQLITADKVTNYALEWLKCHAEKKEKFFMFLHYWDPHTPYLPPKEYVEKFYRGDPYDREKAETMRAFRNSPFYPLHGKWIEDLLGDVQDIEYISALYDAEIAFMDNQLGRLFTYLEENDMMNNTLIVVTADHGESLTEHNIFFDHHGVYETNIHVPLILYAPSLLPQGLRVKSLVGHVDIAPTILGVAGIQAPGDIRGTSLLEIVENEAEEREYVVSGECTYQAYRAIVTRDGWKLIKRIGGDLYGRPRIQLYNVLKDPGEVEERSGSNPDLVRELEYRLDRWVEENLGEKPDPMRIQLQAGLPGHAWLRRALKSRGIAWEEWLQKQRYI